MPEQSNNDELPQALTALTMDTTIVDIEWTTNIGASNHMTANSGLLSNLKTYAGYDYVFISDGSPLTIDAIGDILVTDGKNKLMLRDVLLVPQLTRNLLSISQLTQQYLVKCEFTDDLFCVKERATGRILIMGQRKGDLYMLSKKKEANFFKEANFSNRHTSGTEELWHQHLGHPQNSTINILRTNKLISVSSNKRADTLCESCQLGKLSKLPFKSSYSVSTDIIERIHCDI